MKYARIIVGIILLTFGLNMNAREADSLVLNRMFAYQHEYKNKLDSFTTNCYTKYFFDTQRRNLLMWLIPDMYPFARGERQYVSEQFNEVKFTDLDNVKLKQCLFFTTVPRDRKPFSILNEFTIPQLYSTTLYGDHILSPFHPDNRVFYRYRVKHSGVRQAIVEFSPRLGNNTQLVTGQAVVLLSSGRVLDVDIKGEYDLIRFHSTINQGTEKRKDKTPLPLNCKTNIDFNWLGNRIQSSFVSVYNLPHLSSLSKTDTTDRQKLDKIRPLQLSKDERSVIEQYDVKEKQSHETIERDTTTKTISLTTLKEIGWDVGSYLVRSHHGEEKNFSFNLSPILQPQYLNYSHSRGVSYKMNLATLYNLGGNSNFSFTPTLGYNFKIKQFFYQLPFRYNYNKKKEDFLELVWNNGNRIANSSVLEELKDEKGNLPELEEFDLTTFDDNRLKLTNSNQLSSWLRLEEGLVYHRRKAIHPEYMEKFSRPTVYNSFAPSITLFLQPWTGRTVFSINYERGVSLGDCHLRYGRWEASASRIFRLPSTQAISVRVGGGMYTDKNHSYFMDYANFTENYLEGGWDDNWSGSFQLLDSRMYNTSSYYLNNNISYDTPLLLTSFIPYLGHYVERERFYLNGLLIEHSRPYWEFGYGFSTHLCSIGLFGSFLDFSFQQFGAKFTIELFRRW